MSLKKHILTALSALVIGSAAHAGPVTLISSSDISFGEIDVPVPANTVSGDPVAARGELLAKLDGTAGSYGFENRTTWDLGPNGQGPMPVLFNRNGNGTGANAILATLSGVGRITTGVEEGRFNTTSGGSKYLRVDSGGGFTLSFDSAIAAFGFYGTDIGDFDGTLTAFLRHADGSGEDEFVVRSGVRQASSGALLFWGFASVNASYDQIRFVTTSMSSAVDVFGFDDFIVADASQLRRTTPPPVPEPASLALVGLALLGVAATRRR